MILPSRRLASSGAYTFSDYQFWVAMDGIDQFATELRKEADVETAVLGYSMERLQRLKV